MSIRRPFVDELYLPEDEIARRVGLKLRDWVSLVGVLEHEGLPRKDPTFGGLRYWPAVHVFLDRRNGLKIAGVLGVDGVETWPS
jgi:hypothetical protein